MSIEKKDWRVTSCIKRDKNVRFAMINLYYRFSHFLLFLLFVLLRNQYNSCKLLVSCRCLMMIGKISSFYRGDRNSR